ncbi:MAG: ATP-binding protein involved in chromosome partitioning [Candidatus Sumerlaeota bacterium]|nr:ATP-binding protein involved in chromosome partitioning [Candidatus Sumerlaeota bacterium]
MSALKDKVLAALRTVQDPDLKRDLVTLNMIKSVEVDEAAGTVAVEVELTTPACPLKKKIEDDCRAAIAKVPGINKIDITMSARVTTAGQPEGKTALPGVKNVVAIGSGKGGVGKSTTATNIAVALKELGARVALLDLDIYGPNVPGMMGVTGRPKVINKRIIPIEANGVQTMSMGFLVSEDQPLVWRGPMLHGVMKQLIFDVAWGDVDYLVIDLPPGTGDVQLSLSQMVHVNGSVIVTTPQNVALQDVRKGLAMFQKVEIPVIGIVENMSYHLCPACGHRDEIFDHGGGERVAAELGLNFFGAVPLNSEIRRSMDIGRPVAGVRGSEFYKIYRAVAERVAQEVAIRNAAGGSVPIATIKAD